MRKATSEYLKTYVNDMDMRREGYVEGEKRGRAEGEKLGKAEGEKDTHRFLINKWLQKGKTIAEIAEDLGKSEEYVESLM